ncbi:prepilin peptidase [Photobacterium aquimaris]|uniref:Prepilin peptidase n=1 Tax=Photobacterium aquimaris TaxID=512643 RepID=A0A2T3I0K6_9GAMM|nr:prepilin peptidase [Photobacterium aquimaris]OBU25604.1 hypothetical protein AYY21_08465 [Photobacterium aquimaris]PQJ37097.1 hypothetical protein BTN98_18320 [Photobacterium aquimaris]PSU10048.1 prepilin peptidase [Photobacterium aquimaris]
MTLTTIIATGLGLAVGSFLNVVIYRLPIMAKRNALKNALPHIKELHEEVNLDPNFDLSKPFNLNVPRSACPICNHQITAIENVPILSWLVLNGKCRECKSPISTRYPFVEIVNAMVWGTIAIFYYNQTYLLILNCLLASTFICIMVTNIDRQEVHNFLIFQVLTLSALQLVYILSQSAFVEKIMGIG